MCDTNNELYIVTSIPREYFVDKYTFIYFRISVIFDNLFVTISMWFCIVKFSSIIIPRKNKNDLHLQSRYCCERSIFYVCGRSCI